LTERLPANGDIDSLFTDLAINSDLTHTDDAVAAGLGVSGSRGQTKSMQRLS
jgi:hypothetical protein